MRAPRQLTSATLSEADSKALLRAAGIAALAIDTAPPLKSIGDAPTLRLGQAMNARYIRLPYANATTVSDAVRAASPSP